MLANEVRALEVDTVDGGIVTQVRVASGCEEYRMLSKGGRRTKKSFLNTGKGKS